MNWINIIWLQWVYIFSWWSICASNEACLNAPLIKYKLSGLAWQQDVWLEVCALFHGHILVDGCTLPWVSHNSFFSWFLLLCQNHYKIHNYLASSGLLLNAIRWQSFYHSLAFFFNLMGFKTSHFNDFNPNNNLTHFLWTKKLYEVLDFIATWGDIDPQIAHIITC